MPQEVSASLLWQFLGDFTYMLMSHSDDFGTGVTKFDRQSCYEIWAVHALSIGTGGHEHAVQTLINVTEYGF